MRNAQECAPKTCKCGKRLKPPHWHKLNWDRRRGFHCPHCNVGRWGTETSWLIDCSCGRFYKWTYHPKSNGCWMIRSTLPLFDTKEVVVVA